MLQWHLWFSVFPSPLIICLYQLVSLTDRHYSISRTVLIILKHTGGHLFTGKNSQCYCQLVLILLTCERLQRGQTLQREKHCDTRNWESRVWSHLGNKLPHSSIIYWMVEFSASGCFGHPGLLIISVILIADLSCIYNSITWTSVTGGGLIRMMLMSWTFCGSGILTCSSLCCLSKIICIHISPYLNIVMLR